MLKKKIKTWDIASTDNLNSMITKYKIIINTLAKK
jgi:hypothetical protein